MNSIVEIKTKEMILKEEMELTLKTILGNTCHEIKHKKPCSKCGQEEKSERLANCNLESQYDIRMLSGFLVCGIINILTKEGLIRE